VVDGKLEQTSNNYGADSSVGLNHAVIGHIICSHQSSWTVRRYYIFLCEHGCRSV